VRRKTARIRATTSRAERLDDVIVGAKLEPDHAVGFFSSGGQHDDRHVRALAELAADVEAGAVGEHHIEQYEVRLLTVGGPEGVGHGAHDLRHEAFAFERRGQRLRDRALVLDEQDPASGACHRLRLFLLACE
jgi:hypothetical protein